MSTIMENDEDITSSYITTCVLNAFLSYTAVMLNCLTIYALTKLSSLPRPLKTLLLSLAVSDLGVGLMVQPSYIASLVMEMEQKAENSPAYNNLQILRLHGGFVWLCVFLWSDFFKFRWIHRCLPISQIPRICDPETRCQFNDFKVDLQRIFVVSSTVDPDTNCFIIYAIIFLPLLLTTVPLNFKIVVAVRRHANQIQALQVQPTAQNSGANMRDAAAWRKFAVGTLLVYLAFLVCYLPNFCFLIVYLISDPLSSNTVVLDLFSSTVLFLNSTLNPLIYCWKMRRIRLTILTILRNMLQRLTQN